MTSVLEKHQTQSAGVINLFLRMAYDLPSRERLNMSLRDDVGQLSPVYTSRKKISYTERFLFL